MRIFASKLTLLFAGVLAALPLATSGQTATPEASPSAVAPSDQTIVAQGLTNPRGFFWDTDGTLYVSLAGSGGTSAATEDWPTANTAGPWQGGLTASVVRVEGGCPTPVATDLPSSLDGNGGALGAEAVTRLGDDLYVAVDGGGAAHGNPDHPSGVYRLVPGNAETADALVSGSVELVADLSAWVRANPVASPPPDLDPDGAGYDIVADSTNNVLWVSDPNSGQILTVTPDGTITRIADISADHPVPTKLALDPNGGVYVGTLTPIPYLDGYAKVLHVAPDGTVTKAWTGLTAVVDVAVGPDGALYAAELSTGNLKEPPYLIPESGRIVRQTGPDTAETVADGLMMPIAFEFGPDGALYVALPASGANNGEGTIVRLDTNSGNATSERQSDCSNSTFEG